MDSVATFVLVVVYILWNNLAPLRFRQGRRETISELNDCALYYGWGLTEYFVVRLTPPSPRLAKARF